MPKSEKGDREIIHSNIFGILPKVNQVISILDTICEPNIMILAQAVFEIFCSQGTIGLQWKVGKKKTSKRGYNSGTTSLKEKK